MHQLNLTSESGEGDGGVGEEGGVDDEETAREVGEQEPDSVSYFPLLIKIKLTWDLPPWRIHQK